MANETKGPQITFVNPTLISHGDAMHFKGEDCYLCDHKPMTLANMAKESADVRYNFLNNYWRDGEDFLASLLPVGRERAEIYIEYQHLRMRIHDLLIAEGGNGAHA